MNERMNEAIRRKHTMFIYTLIVHIGLHIHSTYRLTYLLYMSMNLSECLNTSCVGGNMNGTFVNHKLYADDICIISLFQKVYNCNSCGQQYTCMSICQRS